jgi:hypothetical protein
MQLLALVSLVVGLRVDKEPDEQEGRSSLLALEDVYAPETVPPVKSSVPAVTRAAAVEDVSPQAASSLRSVEVPAQSEIFPRGAMPSTLIADEDLTEAQRKFIEARKEVATKYETETESTFKNVAETRDKKNIYTVIVVGLVVVAFVAPMVQFFYYTGGE